MVTITSAYCHFCTHHGCPDLSSAHYKDRAWSLSHPVTAISGYCHFCTHYGSPDLSSAHSKDRAWSPSCLVTVTSVHTSGVLTLAAHTLKTEPVCKPSSCLPIRAESGGSEVGQGSGSGSLLTPVITVKRSERVGMIDLDVSSGPTARSVM